MPSHKKSGVRGSQRETSTTKKNNKFFEMYMYDLKKDGKVDDVYIARVTKMVGDGRVEVFYVDDHGSANLVKAYIRGIFRGKGKHSVELDVNTIVMIADTNIPGAAQYEIMCKLDWAHVNQIEQQKKIDARILYTGEVDGKDLLMNKIDEEGGIRFSEDADEGGVKVKLDEDDDDEINVDAI